MQVKRTLITDDDKVFNEGDEISFEIFDWKNNRYSGIKGKVNKILDYAIELVSVDIDHVKEDGVVLVYLNTISSFDYTF